MNTVLLTFKRCLFFVCVSGNFPFSFFLLPVRTFRFRFSKTVFSFFGLYAVLKDKPHFHISFIMNVSPECDCWNHNDAAIIPDLGMLASADPVALDKACADLVIQAPVLHSDNVLAKKHEHEDLCGCDKFHMIHPDTDWLAGLRHAEKIGLGTMDYELIKI